MRPENVIGETLRRATPDEDHNDPSFVSGLTARVRDEERRSPTDYEDFVADPLSAWIESTFGVSTQEGTGRLIRATVWVQNLDAVERRANPIQRPRYARGLQGLGKDSLGLDEDAWNNLFDAFLALSKGWGNYAKTFKPEKFKKAPRTSKPGAEKDRTWDPESFYVTLEDVRIELPAYFAKVENSGWGIGDFEYLISALPTARLVPAGAPLGTPEQNEGGVAQVEEPCGACR